jgi:hypothetical protein
MLIYCSIIVYVYTKKSQYNHRHQYYRTCTTTIDQNGLLYFYFTVLCCMYVCAHENVIGGACAG